MDGNGQPVEDVVIIDPRYLLMEREVSNAVMDQRNKEFVPHVLAVPVGTKISFPNSDNTRHHVYSFSSPKAFEIKLYADAPQDPVLFENPGIVVLGCNIHDAMVGYIFVSKWQHFTKTNAQGLATHSFPSLPSDLMLWHPWLPDPSEPALVEGVIWDGGVTGLTLLLEEPQPTKTKSRFRRQRWRSSP